MADCSILFRFAIGWTEQSLEKFRQDFRTQLPRYTCNNPVASKGSSPPQISTTFRVRHWPSNAGVE